MKDKWTGASATNERNFETLNIDHLKKPKSTNDEIRKLLNRQVVII